MWSRCSAGFESLPRRQGSLRTLCVNKVAARRIYQRAGFRYDCREPHHSFGRDLVGEYWSRDL
jgi:hypothetical protein